MVHFKDCVQVGILLFLYQSGGVESKNTKTQKFNLMNKSLKSFFSNFKKSAKPKKNKLEEDKLICEGLINNISRIDQNDIKTKTLIIPLNVKNIVSLSVLFFLTLLGSYYIWYIFTRKKCLCKMCKGEYVILEKLSSGGYGDIFKISKNGKLYILKRCPADNISEADEVLIEAKYLRELYHKNIVQYIDDFIHVDYQPGHIEPNYNVIIIMEYCEGGDLKQIIDEHFYDNKNISLIQIVDYLIQICEALNYLHSKNIIHRDIKSQNIFITKDNHVRIGDFGLAKKLKKNNFSRKTAITKAGTDCYMAPEVLRGENYGKPADIWSLGCVIHELCTMIFMWMNDVPIGILSLTSQEYLNEYIMYVKNEKFEFLKGIMKIIFLKDPKKRMKVGTLLKKLKDEKKELLKSKKKLIV